MFFGRGTHGVIVKRKRHLSAKKEKGGLTRSGEIARQKRLELLAFLGGKCVRCGFKDTRALQIDHVNCDGAVHRLRKISNSSFERDVRANRRAFQVLCANCNWIKRVENGEVPRRLTQKAVEERRQLKATVASERAERQQQIDARREAGRLLIEATDSDGHGASTYNNKGCRCDICHAAWAAYIRTRRAQRMARYVAT